MQQILKGLAVGGRPVNVVVLSFVLSGVVLLCLGSASVAAQLPTSQPASEKKQEAQQEGKQESQRPQEEEKPSPETPAAPVDPKTYRIGPEDVLIIRVWKEPELGGGVVVRPDGMISVYLVGEVQASGLTPEQLTEKLKEEYAKLIINPIVDVSVQAVRSKKYYLVGNLNRTGAVPLVVPVTVLEAISMAGGFTEFANKKKVIILRGDRRLYFNYNDVIKGKNMNQNIYLENGDFIIVE